MRVFKAVSVFAIFVAILLVFPLTVPAARGGSGDGAILAARDAYLAGDRAALERSTEKVTGHMLEAYVIFWRLRLGLEEADPTEVQGFLNRYSGTVLAEQLRGDWLRLLGKRGQWELFQEVYPSLAKDDSDIAFYALLARWRQRGDSVFPEIKPFWNAARALPESGAPFIDAMLQSGYLTPQDVRKRFRLLIQANLITAAKQTAERLPEYQDLQAEQIDDVVKAPARFLERDALDLNTAAGRELAIAAMARLVQSDFQSAVSLWTGKLQERFPREDKKYVWALIATQGARRNLPETADWFAKAGDMPLSDEQLAWRTRNALRQKNWSEVRSTIERMSPVARNESVWIYWLGRALSALGAREDGQTLLCRIAGEHDFYGQLAAEELGMPLQIPPKAASPTREELAAVRALPGLQRALALYRIGLRTEASREWVWTVRTMDDRRLLAAAELARCNKIWDCAINTADRTVFAHDFSMRYLTPYHDVLSRQARARQIEEPWIFGLVRQESRFIADAKSQAGASGLMQLLPSTANWVARKIGMKGFHPSRVNRPEVNAALGAFYLRYVLDGLGESPVLAAAAYNAGPGRARRWCDAKPLEGAIYIETIPYAETRQYVKKVMTNTVYYAALLGGEQRSLKSRLGTIAGAMSLKDEAAE